MKKNKKVNKKRPNRYNLQDLPITVTAQVPVVYNGKLHEMNPTATTVILEEQIT